VLIVPLSSLKSCTSGMGSPKIGSLSLLDNLCQIPYRSNTGMAPLVFSLPFGQYVWNVFPVLFDRWFLLIRITLEFGFVSSISSSDRYSGGHPMSSAVLKKVESNVTAGTGATLEDFTWFHYTWLSSHMVHYCVLARGSDTDRSNSRSLQSQACTSEL
jgi:hypothetical protein